MKETVYTATVVSNFLQEADTDSFGGLSAVYTTTNKSCFTALKMALKVIFEFTDFSRNLFERPKKVRTILPITVLKNLQTKNEFEGVPLAEYKGLYNGKPLLFKIIINKTII
jgi:hypothetical protein